MSESSPDPETPATPSLDLGRKGEELAAAYLQQLGYQIVAANFIVPVGRNRNDAVVAVEIDLVAYDGPVLCFVEVKTRASDWFAAPTANVHLRKQRQVARAARVYRRMFDLTAERYRFDVVSIVMSPTDGAMVGDIGAPLKETVKGTAGTSDSGGNRGLQIEVLRNYWSDEKFRRRRSAQDYWE